ncbi:PC-Esterase [Cynara cardunculus var. scolymus]|uniref:PC-Esterase n=1 Tax=Cynara cardunculus var. scolymus TaxID=59895 RepID=A0A103YI25_CYNCS|nr:PC-Esterase [Cynara cardunculus var. scolymus]
MLDSSSNRRIFPQGRYMMFAFVFITFFVLISVLSIFIIPVSSYNFIQYNQSQVSALISRLLSNSTVSSPQFARKFDGFSRRDSWFSSNHNFSSGKTMAKPSSNDQIPKRTNGVSVEAPSPNGLSFNHDFSSWKSRIMPPDDARVSENPNGYLRKVKSPQGFHDQDYNFTVEYYSSPFLVREWKMQNANGSTKETLRLDLVHRSSDLYRNADILVFNTGHWWTHEKTSAGKGYYQEGDHVYKQLHVMEAFRKAMTTWGRWIEAKVSRKTLVDGQWNSGGQCDKDNEPIVLEKDLPHENNRVMMEAAEAILTKMKIPILYLNITRMSEYRRDAHPSIYMKPNMTNEERMTVFKFQDCSHWCLPGVPDTWNEMLYGQLLLKYRQQLLKYKQ